MAAPLISPSILAADFAQLGDEIRAVDAAGADMIHIDVMDGHFVPNLSLGPAVIEKLRPHSKKPFDVHLMITPVDPFLDAYAAAGADLITAHPEAGPHFHRTIQAIRKLGKRPGAALNPSTPESVLDYVLEELDLVLVMSVNPGFGGQSFIESQLRKIESIRKSMDRIGSKAILEVDGGVTPETAPRCIAAGATALVAGSAVFGKGRARYAEAIRAIRNPAADAAMRNPAADAAMRNPAADAAMRNPAADAAMRNPAADAAMRNPAADAAMRDPAG